MVHEDSGGRPVQPVGWCLGGILTLLTVASDQKLPNMLAYPGRTFGQLYHRFFRTNDLADGTFAIHGATLDLTVLKLPVLAIAGRGDGIAPVAACHHIEALLPRAKVELATAPGGHLGVLTGRRAAGTTWTLLDAFLDRAKR